MTSLSKDDVRKAMDAIDDVKDQIPEQAYIVICNALKEKHERDDGAERQARDTRRRVRDELADELQDLRDLESAYGPLHERFERRARVRQRTVARRQERGWYTED